MDTQARAEPFEVDVAEAVLDDLDERLARTRYPQDFGNDDWRYGVPAAYLREVVDHWRDGYDWREHERAINAHANFRATVDGVPIHFIHERGNGPDPIPLIATHGWPWTFWDYRKLIGPLTDPGAFGGDPADAFDLVVPSVPGFAFSTPLTTTGITSWRVADLWVRLMRDVLGYERFGVHGGDWGSLISAQLAHKHPELVSGMHVCMAVPLDIMTKMMPGLGFAPEVEDPVFEHIPAGLPQPEDYAPHERSRMQAMVGRETSTASHVTVNTNEPQTVAYGLNDSPAGLLAHLVQRRRDWSDCHGDVESRFSKDDLITSTMLYWVTESLGSSSRLYWESSHDPWRPTRDALPAIEAPVGVILFARELIQPPDAWMQRYYNLQRVTEVPAGGHFGPMEEPEALVEDLRAFYRPLR